MERRHKVLIGSLAALMVALTGFALGHLTAERSASPVVPGDRSEGRLRVVEDAFQKIQSLSVEAPSKSRLIRGAVRGMAEVLRRSGDTYALYYSPKAYSDFQEITSGKFSGIGVWLKRRGKALEIVSVLPNTPAHESGLQRGDVIETIDGDPAEQLSSDQAVTRIKGKAGTEVVLGVSRAGQAVTFTITRATIDLPNVLANLTPESLGYIRLFGFARGAGDQVRAQVEKLAAKGAEGFILDMRDNGGGLFSEGVEVASVFIEDGEIVSVEEFEVVD
jgi:carboxyl-terminal processing protease